MGDICLEYTEIADAESKYADFLYRQAEIMFKEAKDLTGINNFLTLDFVDTFRGIDLMKRGNALLLEANQHRINASRFYEDATACLKGRSSALKSE